ncbi:DUF2147 domain-containing protein [Flavobacterium sp.]|jgi:uncharacterized protein (DUF2147 family)|uniref:DUF2147 domain-containing protein n=1 Tax=Flavobacterium sp. TaxID=239 RepID=UPI0037BFAD70
MKTKKLKMMSNKLFLMLLLVVGMATTAKAQTKSDAIVGEWLNEEKDTKFQIFKKDNKYFGKVIWGTGGEEKDVKNPDVKLRNRELTGLVILKNFVFDGDETWEDGTIYDPREGKTYSCKITQKGKNQIKVRGFVGISMFGRTEVWTRVN